MNMRRGYQLLWSRVGTIPKLFSAIIIGSFPLCTSEETELRTTINASSFNDLHTLMANTEHPPGSPAPLYSCLESVKACVALSAFFIACCAWFENKLLLHL